MSLIFILFVAAFSIKVDLPNSNSHISLPASLPMVSVSSDSVYLNDVLVLPTQTLTNMPTSDRDPIISRLTSSISKLKEKKDFDSILIWMDKKMPFHNLFTVLNTLGASKISNIYLVAASKNASNSGIFLRLPPPSRSSQKDTESVAIPALVITDSIVSIGINGNTFRTMTVKNNLYSKILDSISFELKKAVGKSGKARNDARIILAFEDQVPYSRVVQFLDFAISLGFSNPQVSKLFMGAKSNGRSREKVKNTVLTHMSELKKLYGARLGKMPELKGMVTAKFAINDHGDVFTAKIYETTLKDEVLENQILEAIKTWKFGTIDKPGDITEIVYPFVFSK